jgi:hypothetical protein
MENKIKSIAQKIVNAALKKDNSDVMNITAAVNDLLDAGFDPHGSLTKLYCYLHDFIDAESETPVAAWRALSTACQYLIPEPVEQWKWCDSFAIFLCHAKQAEIVSSENAKAETEKLKRNKAIEDAFASIGL